MSAPSSQPSSSSPNTAPSHPFRWFPEFLELGHRRLRPQARLLALSLLVGIVAGIGAIIFYSVSYIAFHYAMGELVGYHPRPEVKGEPKLPFLHKSKTHSTEEGSSLPHQGGPEAWWLLLLVPLTGGLLSGWLVYSLAPEAEGHGTDAAIQAYHHRSGRIPLRVPLVKLFASAITLGSGGSGGREGPIAQIGAGFASFLGSVLRLSATERRVLMAAGMAAGISAIFRAPLAGALFAAEVLYRSPDFESEVIIPAALASITAYCTFGWVFGWGTLFALPAEVLNKLRFDDPLHLVPYLVLAVCMAVLAMIYTRTFYGITHLFRRIPIRNHFKPAIGAFLSALIGLGLLLLFGDELVLAVLAFGYNSLAKGMTILNGTAEASSLSLASILVAIALGKILTTGLTIGSGGSAGIFGPSMVIGGCAGGALGILFHFLWPALAPHPATFVIVGMAGFFAAVAKTPFSTLVMVSELTGDYHLLLPALWVCSIAFLISDEQSIYSSQVETRSRSPVHRGKYVREVLTGLRVRRFMTPIQQVPFLSPQDRVPEVIERLSTSPYQSVPVLDAAGKFLGMVTLEEVLLASDSADLRSLALAIDLMRSNVSSLSPDDRLDEAMEEFVEQNLPALPVIDLARNQVVGIVRRADVSSTYLRHVHGVPQQAESEEE